MSRIRLATRAAASLCAAIVLVGCGTTVSTTTAGAPGSSTGPVGSGMGLGGSAGGLGPSDGVAAPGSAAAGELPAGAIANADGTVTTASGQVLVRDASGSFSPAASAGPSAPGSGTTGTTGGDGASGPEDRSPLAVGVLVTDDYSNGPQAQVFGVTTGNNRKQAQAVIDDINKTGGVAGRPIRPVFANYSSTSTENQNAAVCEKLTKDEPVTFVINGVINAGQELGTCFAKAGVFLIGGAAGLSDAKDLANFKGFYYHPAIINATRLGPIFVSQLQTSGWFGSKPRVGIVYQPGEAAARAVKESLRPALAKAGHEVVTEAQPKSTEDMQGIVLQFKSKEIDHVMFLDGGGGVYTFFAQAAEQQGYRPKLGITTYDVPAVTQTLVPPGQLAMTSGVGWAPTADVDSASQPPANAAKKKCAALMEKAGESTGNSLAASVAFGYCDTGFFLQRVAALAGGTDPARFRAAAGTLDRSFGSALAMGTFYRPGTADGAGVVRTLAYAPACRCLQYSGPPRQVS